MQSSISWDKVLTRDSLSFETKDFFILQTHISYVIVTDHIVYKIKKPVNFGFLDFTTLEKRKFYCEQEVLLNRRLCEDLYLGVVGITQENDHYKVEGEGEPIEYAVKMKRLPLDGMMVNLLNERQVTLAHIDLIVKTLVPFYKVAETGERINYYGSLEVISYNCEENFTQTKAYIGQALTQRKFNQIVNYTREFLSKNKRLFEKRIKEGFIRDGHGDLYSANICFDNLRRVYIFDCIEFNERFRCGDVASDLSFLAMDLDYHRRRDLSQYFIERYQRESNDPDLYHLLDFYKCYRAYVRGKIGCFTFGDPKVPPEERYRALKSAQCYFDLAFSYAGGVPKVAIFMGLSGTGKTTLAKNFIQKVPAVYISSDIVRKELLGIRPEEHHYADFEKGIYSPEITERTYQAMIESTLEEISYGRDVVLDATFREKRHREWLKEALKKRGIVPYWIFCHASDEVIKRRIEKRSKEMNASDALFETYLAQKTRFEPPTEEKLLKLETTSSIEELIVQISQFLQF